MKQEYIEELTNEVENRIYDSGDDSQENINELIRETIDNYKEIMEITNSEKITAYKQIKANIEDRFSQVEFSEEKSDLDDLVENVLLGNIKYASYKGDSDISEKARYINEFYGEEIVAEKLSNGNLFLYSKKVSPNEIINAMTYAEKNKEDIDNEMNLYNKLKKNLRKVNPDISEDELDIKVRDIVKKRTSGIAPEMIDKVGPTTSGMPLQERPVDYNDIKHYPTTMYEAPSISGDSMDYIHSSDDDYKDFIFFYEDKIDYSGNGIVKAIVEGEEILDIQSAFEVLFDILSYEISEFADYDISLYISDIGDYQFLVDCDLDRVPSDIVEDAEDWLANNVIFKKESKVAAGEISHDHLPGWVGPDFETWPHQSPYVMEDDSMDHVNKVLYGEENVKPEKVMGYLSFNEEENEYEFVFKDEVFDVETGETVNSIVFEKEDVEKLFESVDFEMLKTASLSSELYIRKPLATKKKRNAFKIKASSVVMSKEEALKADIDFVTPLQRFAYQTHGVFLEQDAVNMVISEVKDIYGTIKSFSKYPKNVISNIISSIVKNPNSFDLYNMSSKIQPNDKVFILSLPGNPIGIVREANDEKVKVERGTILDPVIEEYNLDEVMKKESMVVEDEKPDFEAFNNLISLRQKTREIISKTLKEVKASDIIEASYKESLGWMDEEIIEGVSEFDYDIGKEIMLRNGSVGKIIGFDKSNALRVNINGNEIPIWKSEIKRRYDNV